jgi:hypothetical protein
LVWMGVACELGAGSVPSVGKLLTKDAEVHCPPPPWAARFGSLGLYFGTCNEISPHRTGRE